MTPEIDELQLTAFALGELPEGPGRAAVEAHLTADPDARRYVAEVRATADLLAAELAKENDVGLTPLQHVVIEQQLELIEHPERAALARRRLDWRTFKVAAFSAAAAAVVVGGVGIGLLSWMQQKLRDQYAGGAGRQVPGIRIEPGGIDAPAGTVARPGGADASTNLEAPGPGLTAELEAWKNKDWGPGLTEPASTAEPRPADSGSDLAARPGEETAAPGDVAVAQVVPADSDDRRYPAAELPGGARAVRQPVGPADGALDGAFHPVMEQPLSTFALDVDTDAYANVRRFITAGSLPPADQVRVEGLINYFPYNLKAPAPDSAAAFHVDVEVAACPWNPAHRLARVAVKGKDLPPDRRPPANVVFLVDVSGSMTRQAGKLPLVKRSLRLLTQQLRPEDRVAIVAYGDNAAGVVLIPTAGNERPAVMRAIDRIDTGGPTANDDSSTGIELAYKLAAEHFARGGVNRVILCTDDGDFADLGVTNDDDGALTRLVAEKANAGVSLGVLGFGMGNLRDDAMAALAAAGRGEFASVDTLAAGRRALAAQVKGTPGTIARDVKVRVEFNPAVAAAYRLIGYDEWPAAGAPQGDADAAAVNDSGEVGAGHAITALYEIVPLAQTGVWAKPARYDATLKYVKPAVIADPNNKELLTVKLRYQTPAGEPGRPVEVSVTDGGAGYQKASDDFKFAAAVAGFGMVLRGTEQRGSATIDSMTVLAAEGKGKDEGGYREEFLDLARKARALVKRTPAGAGQPR